MNANTKKPLINYKQTLDILNKVAEQHSLKNEYETIPVTDIVGRISAEEIKSTIEVPSFNNSAMDGFAVHAQYINQQLSVVPKVKIKVTGQIQAGDGSDVFVTDDSVYAWEIMTGAPVPEMYDSVIPIEHVMVEQFNGQQFITIDKFIKTGQNVRLSGTDYRLGQEVLRKHTTLHAQHVMALATVGVSELQVLKHIPVAIFSTGNELVDRSNSTLESGKIFNSNQPFLQSFLKNITCDPVYVASCQDIEAKFEELLDLAKEQGVKIIFSTGAVSMGRYDFVPKVLKQRGATIHFHKARVRPGKPILFAELPDGTIYFGLPGNPIAAASGVRFFATPFIRTMQGLEAETSVKALLLTEIHKKLGFRTFAKAKASVADSGQLQVEMLLGQGSFQTHSFAQSNCWLVLSEEIEHMAAGELVDILPMVPGALTL